MEMYKSTLQTIANFILLITKLKGQHYYYYYQANVITLNRW